MGRTGMIAGYAALAVAAAAFVLLVMAVVFRARGEKEHGS